MPTQMVREILSIPSSSACCSRCLTRPAPNTIDKASPDAEVSARADPGELLQKGSDDKEKLAALAEALAKSR